MTLRLATRMATAMLGIALALAPPAHATGTSDSVTYTYDALGRIHIITYANGTTITYTYDLATNRLAQTVACGSSGC